jgi:hypothetical protein
MNKEEFFKKHNIKKPAWGGNKEIIEQLINLFNEHEDYFDEERRRFYIKERKQKELQQKLEEYENSIFNGFEAIYNENHDLIGIEDEDKNYYYLEDHLRNEYVQEIEYLKDKIDDLDIIRTQLKKDFTRAKKRIYSQDDTIEYLLKSSGILLLIQEYGEIQEPKTLPYKVRNCHKHDEIIAEICFYKRKFWVHKTDKTNNFEGEIIVDGVDLVSSKKKRLKIDFDSRIIVTTDSDYDHPYFEYKLVNRNIVSSLESTVSEKTHYQVKGFSLDDD